MKNLHSISVTSETTPLVVMAAKPSEVIQALEAQGSELSQCYCTNDDTYCEPFVLGPALAIDKTPGPVCFTADSISIVELTASPHRAEDSHG